MKASPVYDKKENLIAYAVECVGCKSIHVLYVDGHVKWEFNGDLNIPTFTPSLLVNKDLSNESAPRCHSFIKQGKWHYLNDCTHDLAGRIVDMVDVD